MLEAHILKLPTPRLLAFYKKHYRGINPYGDYYGYGAEDGNTERYEEWNAECEAIKEELANREHIT